MAKDHNHLEDGNLMIFKDMNIAICHLSFEGKFISVNKKLCDYLGYSSDELLNMHTYQITHPDDLAKGLETKTILRKGLFETLSAEKRYIKKDGTVVWAECKGTLLNDKNGNPLCYIVKITDFSDLKEYESVHKCNW